MEEIKEEVAKEEVKEEKPVVKKKKKVAEVVAEVAEIAPEAPKLVTVKAGGHKVTGYINGTKITTLDGVTYDL